MIKCNITNFYDHDISNILLIFEDNFISNWYDSNGNLLKSNSNNYTIDNLSSLSSINLLISKISNSPPIKPTIIGSISGKSGIEYEYSFSTTDPDGDNIFYHIYWGDDSDKEIIGPIVSGDTATVKHIWSEQGVYSIKAKAKDIVGLESDWSDPLIVTIAKIKLINTLFPRLLKNNYIILQIL
jgi:hypothetical protein